METRPLTDEQIENWRKALCLTLGPYALLMPKEQIQRIRDKMQRDLVPETAAEKEKSNG